MSKGTSALAGAGTGAAAGAGVAGPWGAVIGALVGAVGGLIINDTTNYENKKRQEENQAWQESMVDKQNVYNSPAEQMQRYKEAGINPSTLGMASGALAGGNLSASPSGVSTIPYQSYDITHAISNMMSAFNNQQEGLDRKSQRQVQLEKTQEEVNQLKENTKLLGLNAQAQQIVNTYAAAREQYAIAEADGRVKKLFSDMNLNYRQMSYLNSQIKQIEYNISNVLPAEVNKIVAETGVSYLEQDKIVAIIKDYYASAELKSAQTETEGYKQENLQASTANLEASTEKTEAETNRYDEVTNAYLDKTGAEVRKLAADAGYTEEQTYWYAFELADRNTINAFGVPLGVGQSYRKIQRGKKIGERVKNKYGVE